MTIGRVLGLTAVLLAAGSAASASDVERKFPDFTGVPQAVAPKGFQALGGRILPYAMTGVGFDSNVLPQRNTDEGSMFVEGMTGLSLQTGAWHGLKLSIDGMIDHIAYVSQDTETRTEFDTNLLLEYNAWRNGTLYFEMGYLNDYYEREHPNDTDTVEPIVYYQTPARLGVRHENKNYLLQLDWRFMDMNHNDGLRRNWVPSNWFHPQRPYTDLDHEEYGWWLTAGLKPVAGWMPFVEAHAVRLAYDEHSWGRSNNIPEPFRHRSSDNWGVVAGAKFDLKGVRGKVFAGYEDQAFDDQRLPRIRMVDFGADVTVPLATKTALLFQADRSIEETNIFLASGYVLTEAEIGVSTEVAERLVLTPSLTVFSRDFEGIDRRDTAWGGGLEATYYWRRWLHVAADLNYESHSYDNGLDFNRWTSLVSMRAQW